jgi:hypothetical protein
VKGKEPVKTVGEARAAIHYCPAQLIVDQGRKAFGRKKAQKAQKCPHPRAPLFCAVCAFLRLFLTQNFHHERHLERVWESDFVISFTVSNRRLQCA